MKTNQSIINVKAKKYLIKEIKEVDTPWLKKVSLKYYWGKFCVLLGRKFFLEKLPGYHLEDKREKEPIVNNIESKYLQMVKKRLKSLFWI